MYHVPGIWYGARNAITYKVFSRVVSGTLPDLVHKVPVYDDSLVFPASSSLIYHTPHQGTEARN